MLHILLYFDYKVLHCTTNEDWVNESIQLFTKSLSEDSIILSVKYQRCIFLHKCYNIGPQILILFKAQNATEEY